MHASLKQLRYFVTIANCGKLSEASKQLHISQPALSAALSQLEDIWEAQLFVRHKAQGVSLTSNGELLVRHARQLLQQAEHLDEYARGLNQQIAGTIQIGCFTTLAPIIIPTLLQQARITYPDMTVQVLEGNLIQLADLVLEGRLEIALSYRSITDARVMHEPLLESHPYVLLPQDHPLTAHSALTLEQLAAEPMILLDLPESQNYFIAAFQHWGYSPNVVYRSTNYEMVRSLVASGLGFSILGQRPRTNTTYNGKEVQVRPLKIGQATPLMISLVRHKEVTPSMRADAVMSLIRSVVVNEDLV